MVIAVIVLGVVVLAEGVVIWQLLNKLLVQAAIKALTLKPAPASAPLAAAVAPAKPKVMSIRIPS